MSTELEFRRQRRERQRKRMIKRRIIFTIFSLIIITVLCLCVKNNFSDTKKNNTETPQFIFNGYIYPEPLPKSPDILKGLSVDDGVKTAYLTFDDGPNNSVTIKVLDVLRRYNVKATFFMVGSLIEKNPQVARRIYDEGHTLANHSYSHNYSELYSNGEEFMSQINKTQSLISDITCKNNYPKIFRFPGGGYNAGSYGEVKQSYKELLKNADFYYCDWNSLTGDAETASPTAEYVVGRIKETVNPNKDTVVLMHDALAKSVTAETLPQVIEYLMSLGFTFDTLDNV